MIHLLETWKIIEISVLFGFTCDVIVQYNHVNFIYVFHRVCVVYVYVCFSAYDYSAWYGVANQARKLAHVIYQQSYSSV
jgi:hypothetical protein